MKKTSPVILKKVTMNMEGPIVIFGAGGFIGINLLLKLLEYRDDIYAVSHDSKNNWRFKYAKISSKFLLDCDISDISQLEKLFKKIKPKTVFNLAAYGAYSKQKDINKTYETNFTSTVNILELAKKYGFGAYVHAGSQSEYGLNAAAPKENDELTPNSHYAVSKVSDYYLLKYYGKVEKLPVVHLRLYSAYGPWEEPDRLIPVLIASARHKSLPPFVNPLISRDFIYVDDIISAFIAAAGKLNKKNYGEAFNVANGKQTTIRELAFLTQKIFHVVQKPVFGSMKNRKWDLAKWYGNSKKMQKVFNWKPQCTLREGLQKTADWQASIEYDKFPWKNPKN